MSKKSLSKNYLYNTAYNIFNILVPLITTPYLARILGTLGVGVFAYYFAIAQYFVLFAKLGLSNYGTRHVAQTRDDINKLKREFSNIYLMQILMTIIVSVLYFGYVILFAKEKIISGVFGIWVLSVFFDIDWLFFALEEFKITAIRSFIVKVISTFLIFVLVKSIDDIWKYSFITALSYSIGYFYLWIKCRKYISFKNINFKDVIVHIKPCFILMIPVIAVSIYRSMDKVMLGAMSNMNQTGLYEYAEKIIYCLTACITSLGTVMMPRMSHLASVEDKKTSAVYMLNSLIFIIFLSCGMCFGLLSISETLIPWFYGEEFRGSIILLNLLSVTLPFVAWANIIRALYIIPNKKDSIYIGSFVTGAICNLICNFIAIPFFGATGACIGTIIAELSVPVYQYLKLRKELPYKEYIKKTIPFVAIGTLMFIVCYILKLIMGASIISMICQIIVGGVVYFLLAWLIYKKMNILISNTKKTLNNSHINQDKTN